MTGFLSVRNEEGVGVVTMENAATLNSFDPGTLGEMRAAFDRLLADDQVRAIVLTGSGKAFSAGADVAAFRKGIEAGTITQWILDATEELHPMLRALHESDKPMVAAVGGVAAGGGLGLALAADSRIGSPDARFAAGYFGIGASPDGGATWFLPRLVGEQRARRFFFENEVMDADEALRVGLLDEVVPPGELLERAMSRARRWAAWSRHSILATKRLLAHQSQNGLQAQLDLERGLIAAAGGTPGMREGVAAFLEKRRPDFS